MVDALKCNRALKTTHLVNARCDTIRFRLLKIGAVIIRNTRRANLLLSGTYPLQSLFLEIAQRLAAAG